MATETAEAFVQQILSTASPLPLLEQAAFSLEDQLGAASDERTRGQLLKLHAFWAFSRSDHKESADLSLRAYQAFADAESLKNYAIAARKSADKELAAEASRFLEGQLANHTDKPEEHASLLDVLSHNYGFLGDRELVARFGSEALAVKDAHAKPTFTLADGPRKPFNYANRQRNIIAFSLFGSAPRYLVFARENVQAAKYLYPGWSCRFYHDDTVPADALAQLRKLGAQTVARPRHNPAINSGLYWRFEAVSDPSVDYFLVRDADSLVNVRERVAVDDWLSSDKPFHVMRDFYSHSELILAGMWGGRSGVIPDIPKLIGQYQRAPAKTVLNRRNQDQLFLREIVWPVIKEHACVHDSVFRFGAIRPFPEVGGLPPTMHVGQDMSVFLRPGAQQKKPPA